MHSFYRTGKNLPVSALLRRFDQKEKKIIEDQVDEMLKMNVKSTFAKSLDFPGSVG